MYHRRNRGDNEPWTHDTILEKYRFTNVYRATDRVSQYLIREVQYNPERSQDLNEVFFRTMLFKLFNKIETWESLEKVNGPLSWSNTDLSKIDSVLTGLMDRGKTIYSAAYIMPSPAYGSKRKHTNHLSLLKCMMNDRVPDRIKQVPDLQSVYNIILSYPGLGPFLAYQYAIDLNYSSILQFGEDGFVVAGPGALDGISKCFTSTGGMTPSELIQWVTDRQEIELAARSIKFPGLYGRKLQPIDCQNIFCEISKYARVAHPEISGVANRNRIKQGYRTNPRDIPLPFFPPRWELSVNLDQPVTKLVGGKTRLI